MSASINGAALSLGISRTKNGNDTHVDSQSVPALEAGKKQTVAAEVAYQSAAVAAAAAEVVVAVVVVFAGAVGLARPPVALVAVAVLVVAYVAPDGQVAVPVEAVKTLHLAEMQTLKGNMEQRVSHY